MNFVIVVNYNNKKDSLSSLNLLKKVPNIKTIFVDNNSSDNSVFEIRKSFPSIIIIENPKNYGFAKANNIGIKYALKNKANKILLLNNDTVFSSEIIEKLFKSKGDIVGSVLEFKRNGSTCFDLGGHINFWLGRAIHEEVDSKRLIKSGEVDYVSGAVMLVQKEVFDKIGLFDESYFLYYEDADFCTRAKRTGFKIAINTDTIIYHKLGATLGRKSIFTIYNNLRSNLIFIYKNISLIRKPFALAYWSLLCVKVILNWFLSK